MKNYTRKQKEAFLIDVLNIPKKVVRYMKIKDIDKIIANNRQNFDEYYNELGNLPEL